MDVFINALVNSMYLHEVLPKIERRLTEDQIIRCLAVERGSKWRPKRKSLRIDIAYFSHASVLTRFEIWRMLRMDLDSLRTIITCNPYVFKCIPRNHPNWEELLEVAILGSPSGASKIPFIPDRVQINLVNKNPNNLGYLVNPCDDAINVGVEKMLQEYEAHGDFLPRHMSATTIRLTPFSAGRISIHLHLLVRNDDWVPLDLDYWISFLSAHGYAKIVAATSNRDTPVVNWYNL